MSIKVLQGEREMARDNWKLGEFELEFERRPKECRGSGVQFEIDANGILHVLARDTKTGREKIVEMKSAVDVSDEAVEKMLAESLEHAFEDVNERIWTETKLKSDEMLDRGRLRVAVDGRKTRARRKGNNSATGRRRSISHGIARIDNLKRANEALDHATQKLAAMIIESVVGSAELKRWRWVSEKSRAKRRLKAKWKRSMKARGVPEKGSRWRNFSADFFEQFFFFAKDRTALCRLDVFAG